MSVAGVIACNGFSYFEVRIKEGFKQGGLTRFLDNAWAACSKNLLVVWDNASSHKSQTIKAFLAKQCKLKPRIWLAHIPPYSPELNPIEQVWAYLKRTLANYAAKNVFELKNKVLKTIHQLQNCKHKIPAFFKHKELECYHFFN